MNILFINSARNWGGNEKWTKLACESLAKEHNVYLAFRKNIIGSAINVTKFKLPFFSEFDLYSLLKLIRVIRKNKIDVIIPTKKKDYVLAGITSRITKIKNVLRLGIVRKLKNSLSHKLIYDKLVDGIIVNAIQIKNTLQQTNYMKDKEIAVIYNGVDTELLNIVPSKPETVDDKFRIISIGSLIKRKNMDVVIKAFARFVKFNNLKDSELYIVGEGKERKNLEEIVKKESISEFVKLTGFLDNPYEYLNICDIFILCSDNEGISNAILEAMFMKKIVISTNSGGIDYAIRNGENGYLVNTDPEQISNIFLKIHNSSEVKSRIGINAQKTINEKFSLEIMNNNIEIFLHNIVNKEMDY